MKRCKILVFLGLVAALLTACYSQHPATISHPVQTAYTLHSALKAYQPAAETRLKPYFKKAGVTYPPAQMALLAFKQEKRMELWAHNAGQPWTLIRSYPILAAAGIPGPKLHSGDRQVPEGIYHIVALNPHSHYHLSMRLDYPNKFDQHEAHVDGRHNLGGDIYIHGSDLSIGCLAMGNTTIEELFVLAYETGLPNIQVVIAPNDLRHEAPLITGSKLAWLPQLYIQLRYTLAVFS